MLLNTNPYHFLVVLGNLYIFHKLNIPFYGCFYIIKQLCLFRSFFLIVTQLSVSNNLVNHVFNPICLLSDLMQAYSKFRKHVFSLISYDMDSTTSLLLVIILLLSFSFASLGLFRYVSAFVHIVSPEREEAVPAGSSLTVSGNSDDNPQFNYKVLIIVNDKRPYQGSELGSQKPFVFQVPGENSREE